MKRSLYFNPDINKISECNYRFVYDIKRLFQQYFSYIVAVSFIGGGNQSTQRKSLTVTSH